MVLNNITNNQYSTPPISVARQLNNEAITNSANTVPNISRPIQEPNVLRKSSNNVYPNFIRQVYSNNQSSSHGSLTESFIRSRASLSPTYMHNEITTRYEMISTIPRVFSEIKKSVNKIVQNKPLIFGITIAGLPLPVL